MANNDISFVFKVDTNAAKASMEKFLQDARQKAAEGISVSLKTGDATTAKGLVSGLASGFDAQKQAAIESFEAQKKALATMAMAGKSGSKEFDAAKRQLIEAKKAAEQFDNALADIDPAPASKSAGGLLGALSSINPAALAAGGGLAYMADAAVKMDEATAKIRTLGGAAKDLAPDLQAMSLEMSKSMPISPVELQTAAYDALSAGIKATKEDMGAFVEASGKLAIGGGESVSGSVNLLSSMVNAYGESAQKAGEYSDYLFTTVNLGKTTIPELNASLSQVIPTAVQAGIDIKNVGASLALMTANGIPTAQATTKLNQLFVELMKPGKELEGVLKKAGVSIDSLKNESLPENLKRIKAELEKTGTVAAQAFSSNEAAGAFATLTKDVSSFESYLSQFDGGAGATQAAFEEMSKSVGVQFQQLKAQAEAFGIEIAGKILPAISGVASAAAPVLGYVFGLIQSSLPLITTATGVWAGWKAVTLLQNTALYAELVATKATTGAISLKTVATTVATKAVNAMKAAWATNPLGVAILGIVAAVAAFKALQDAMTETAQEKLEAAQAEGKYLAEQKKSVEKDREQVKSKKELVDEYIKLGSKAKMTADETAKFKKIQGELQTKYPGLIKDTNNFGNSLGDLKKFSEDSVNQLAKLDGKLADLDKQILKNRRTMADARMQVANETLWDTLQDAQGIASRFWDATKKAATNGKDFSPWDVLRGQLVEYNNELSSAALKSEEAIKTATNKMKTVVGKSELFTSKDRITMLSAIEDMERTAIRRLQVYNTKLEEVKKEGEKPGTVNTPPPGNTGGDNKDKTKKDAEEFDKKELERQKSYRDKSIEIVEQYYQELKDARARGEAPQLSAVDLVKEEQERLDALQTVWNNSTVDAGRVNLKSEDGKKAFQEFIHDATTQVRDFDSKIAESIGKIGELSQAEQDALLEARIQNVTLAIDQPSSREQLLAARKELADLLSQKENAVQLKMNSALTESDKEKAIAELTDIQKRSADNSAQIRALLRADELAGITDLAEYQKEISLDQARETLFGQLAIAGENINEQMKAWKEFFEAKKGIEESYAQQTVSIGKRAVDALYLSVQAFAANLTLDTAPWADKVSDLEQRLSDLRKKSTEEEKNAHESETKSLIDSLRKKELAQQDYFKKIDDLNSKKAEKDIKGDEDSLKRQIAAVKSFEALQMASQTAMAAYTDNIQAMMTKNAEKWNKEHEGQAMDLKTTFEGTSDDFKNYAFSAVGSSVAAFGAMIAAGQNIGEAFSKGMLANLLSTAEQAIVTYIPQIYAAFMSWLGPWGIPAATAALPVVYGALEYAKSKLGRKTGEVDISGPGTETSDDIPRFLSRHESVITAKGTKAQGNKELFQWINGTGGSAIDYFSDKIRASAAQAVQDQLLSLNLEKNLTHAAIENAMKHIELDAPKKTVEELRRKINESAALDRRVHTVVNNVTNYYNSMDTRKLEAGINNLGKKVDEFTKALNEKGYVKEIKAIHEHSINANESKLFTVSEKKRVHEVGRK